VVTTYRAIKLLRVEIVATREQLLGAAGEDMGSTCLHEDVPAGEALTLDQVIAATQSFVDANGQPMVFTDEDGLILSEIDDDVAEATRTQLDAWLADGSVVIEKEG
jgi:hypothetical protein